MTDLGGGIQKSFKDSSGGKSKKERKMRINILANIYDPECTLKLAYKQQELHLNVAPGNAVREILQLQRKWGTRGQPSEIKFANRVH